MSERNSEESLVASWSEAQQQVLPGWLNLLQGTIIVCWCICCVFPQGKGESTC